MRIDPRALRLFLAVCREGTISGAARAEHLSQPSVSVAISQLERVLATKLFTRNRQGIELTAAGLALKTKSQAIESLLVSAKEEIDLLAKDIGGPLTIGGTPGALASVIGKVIPDFSNRFPKFKLRILERADTVTQEMLRNYEIDLAVVTAGMREVTDEFTEKPVLSDPFSIIVGTANADMPDTMNLKQLKNKPWVLPDAVGGFRRQIDALFINSSASIPANVILSDSILTTKSIIKNSDYITILPLEVVKTEIENGSLRSIQIEGVSFQRKVGLLWLAERQLSTIAEAFIAHTTAALDV
ncbi:LysR family transcriptional regulator [uncultured Alteromonas sp.]|jgi:molybdate transport repressor ModE-like protein|uniref:LysR family transcriptional regulator n=1 Tax=uncultured Alteromonas sp. TaxID=179113 RepID=UPI0025E85770|nr:LysR family transcriptional regulator [uncultured Alteromonas sp.]